MARPRRAWWDLFADEPLDLHAWLLFGGSNPEQARKAWWSLIERAADFLLRFGPDLVLSTSEPRDYRVATGAWRLARAPFEDGRLDHIFLAPERAPYSPDEPGLLFSLFVLVDSDGYRTHVSLEIPQVLRGRGTAPRTPDVLAVFREWTTEFGPCQATLRVHRKPVVPAALAAGAVPWLGTWPGTCSVLRDLGWWTYLGPGLCAPLGEASAARQAAPCWRAELLGEGVLLQVSDAPGVPVRPDTWLRLLEYLRPILATAAARAPTTATEPSTVRARPRSRRAPDIRWPIDPPSFVVEVEEIAGRDAVFNLYLSAPGADAELSGLIGALHEWYAFGSRGGFGGLGFHGMSEPVLAGTAIRWAVDLGSADDERAIRGLASWLEVYARSAGLSIDRLVVGRELVE